MDAIRMSHITKTFGTTVALSDVNLQIRAGEVHCLLGENGAGKSTLMNILYGLYQADSGAIEINEVPVEIPTPRMAQSLAIGMVHQHFMLVESMTVLQNIILGSEEGSFAIDYEACRERIEVLEQLYHFDFNLDSKVSQLSVGEMQRVEIFKAVYRGADIIILDEPTAVLTPQEVDVLFRILDDMRKQGKTIIFITHKLQETMRLSDRVTVLRSGYFVGTVETKDTNPEALATMMVGHEVDLVTNKGACCPGEPVLEIHDLKIFENSDHTIDITVRAGEIYGIAGVDGNGQQELERFIVGSARPKNGRVKLNGVDVTSCSVSKRKHLGLGIIPSDRHKDAILPDMSLIDNFLLGLQRNERFSSKGLVRHSALHAYADSMINAYSIKVSSTEQHISELSGGNQQKLVFSREVGMDPVLLVAAQPVRGLDIGAIDYIHNQLLKLRDRGQAILLISTELSEIMEMSDRIGVLYKGGIIAERNAEDFTKEELGLYMAGGK
ncbi:ABC transporter ATP-binding protein [Pleomorphochaeta sp. DL1XJH-081]|uniref:ABC transporter ATP-binding protein n=1 Tax=Pleomorphochaeta sp. DL1XJH-081 TaxID=3409690 RepID=UPI003BB58B42